MGIPERIWSRDEIAAGILKGQNLVIYHDLLLRIPHSWLAHHPGGELAILHFVGRDASDEVDAYHAPETLRMVLRYVVGRVQTDEDGWEPFMPPIASGWRFVHRQNSQSEWLNEAAIVHFNGQSKDTSERLLVERSEKTTLSEQKTQAPTRECLNPPPSSLSRKTQNQHSLAYKALHKRVTEEGLYQTPYLSGYGPEVLRYALLASLSAWTYSLGWYITSAVFLGLLWHQLTFIAHDLGHMGVTHSWVVDRLLGIFIADFLGGLSIGWWVNNHNVHHLVTNHPSHDPDIEHIPFFAISTHFLHSLYSTYYRRIMSIDPAAKFLLSLQHKLFYLIMAFARFNLYANSYGFLAKSYPTRAREKARGGRWSWWLEIVGIGTFWVWYGRVLAGCGTWRMALAYVVVSHVVASPLHVQIVLSHFSRSTEDLGPVESFPHRQLRTTTDVICPDSLAFIHGGLHLQVTHHLFPRIPRHNLRRTSKLVKQFAKEQGLEYAEFGFVDGNNEVRSVLRSVAEQVKVVHRVAEGEVQDAMRVVMLK